MNRRTFLQSAIAVPLVAIGMPRVPAQWNPTGFGVAARIATSSTAAVEIAGLSHAFPVVYMGRLVTRDIYERYLRGKPYQDNV